MIFYTKQLLSPPSTDQMPAKIFFLYQIHGIISTTTYSHADFADRTQNNGISWRQRGKAKGIFGSN
jgi:hypothetical protein